MRVIIQLREEWKAMSDSFFGKDPNFLKYQALVLSKSEDKYHWSEKDDENLRGIVDRKEKGEWTEISKEIFLESETRNFISPKQCKSRW